MADCLSPSIKIYQQNEGLEKFKSSDLHSIKHPRSCSPNDDFHKVCFFFFTFSQTERVVEDENRCQLKTRSIEQDQLMKTYSLFSRMLKGLMQLNEYVSNWTRN